MLKKALIGLIAISLSLGMVACGGSNNQANANKNNESSNSATQAEPETNNKTQNNEKIDNEFVVTNDITHYDDEVSQEEFNQAEKATVAFVKSTLNIDGKELSDANKLNELVNNMFSNYSGKNLNNEKQEFTNYLNKVVIPNEQKTNITKINLNEVDRDTEGIELEGIATVKVNKFLNKKQIEGTEQKIEFSVTTQNGKVVDYDIDDLIENDD